MEIHLIDPKGNLNQPQRSHAPRLGTFEGLTIGLLSNQKVNADVLLNEVATLFAEEHGCKALTLVEKHNTSLPADPALLRDLSERADFLIVAAGD
jgi:hypothetical protein